MVLAVIELANGILKKAGVEVASFAFQFAKINSQQCTVLAIGKANIGEIEKFNQVGIQTILHADDARLNVVLSKAYTKIITNVAQKVGANVIILSHNSTGKTIAPRVAIRTDSSLVPGVSSLPNADGLFTKTVFSGKAATTLKSSQDKMVVTLNPNSFKLIEEKSTATIEKISIEFNEEDIDYIIEKVEKESDGMIPLPEAELVVSAGRGMKGPENWGMIEEMAKILGATTACSRPVADIGWRPHHEHVGQTGITIKPNLYIAIGISGAIQHLAGVNQSKCIVVINKDIEAPFFKAADYGIVGDAFEIVPKLNEALKQYKLSHH